MRSTFILLACLFAFSACGDDDATPDGGSDGPAPGPTFQFAYDEGGQTRFTEVPYPNDLLRGADGKIAVTADTLDFPGAAMDSAVANVVAGLSRLDGFSVTTGALFPVANLATDEVLDPATVGTPTLVDLGDGTTFPVTVHAKVSDGQLHVAPQTGRVLLEGHTYGIVVSAGVKTTTGRTVGVDPNLQRLLTTDTGPAYAPLRAWLGTQQIDPATVVAATVFTTATPHVAIQKAREALVATPPPVVAVDRIYAAGPELDDLLGTPVDDNAPGTDNEGGVAHAAVAAVVLGHYSTIDFLSAPEKSLGTWDLDAAGAPLAKGVESVPFLLALPSGADLTNVPVVIFGHGLGASRAVVMALANGLCARGYAVIGIDIPFHGDRYPTAIDDFHNFTGAAGGDGLADGEGLNPALLFFDVLGDMPAGIQPFDPTAIASSFRQTVVDYMSEARVLEQGDWSALDPDFPGLAFDTGAVVYTGESFGAITGGILVPFEPRLRAFVLDVGGGPLLGSLLENSPEYWPIFGTLAAGQFGVPTEQLEEDPPHTSLAFLIFQQLLEPGDPATYAPLAFQVPLDQPHHVLMLSAYSDESVPNQAGETLASAFGLEWAPTGLAPAGAPRYVSTMPTATLPVQGNVAGTTAAYVMVDPATHGMLTRQRGQRNYQVGFPPFVMLPTPEDIDNPIVGLQEIVGTFADTYRSGGTPQVVDPF